MYFKSYPAERKHKKLGKYKYFLFKNTFILLILMRMKFKFFLLPRIEHPTLGFEVQLNLGNLAWQ